MPSNKGKEKAQPDNKADDIRKQLTELEAKIQDLYTQRDQLDMGLEQGRHELYRIGEQRTKKLKAQLQKMVEQGAVEPLSINHDQ